MARSMRKRRTKTAADAVPAKRTRTNHNKRPSQPGRSLILEMPPEIRNQIYEFVALHYDVILHPRSNGKLATASPLCRVSHQVRGEYLGILYIEAPEIKACVKDFNFGHVIKFFNNLSERELNALPTINQPSLRHLQINVDLTDACGESPDELRRWLRRCQNPTKKGTTIDASYVVRGRRGGPQRYWDGAWNYTLYTSRDPHPLSPVGKVYKGLRHSIDWLPEGRTRDEAEKIFDALGRVSGPNITSLR